MNIVVLYIRRSRRYFFKNILDDKPEILGEKHLEDIKKFEELWFEIFGKSISETKRQISDIAFTHNIDFKPDIIYNYSIPRCLPIGSYIYPIDEDDLIDNKALTAIRQYRGSNQFIVWNTSVVTHNRIVKSESPGLLSNSYAIKYVGNDITELLHKHVMFHDDNKNDAYDIGITSGMKVTSPASVGSFKAYKDINNIKDIVDKFVRFDDKLIPNTYREAFKKIKECLRYS
jgi:hypothetical protein